MESPTDTQPVKPSWIREGLEGHFEQQDRCRRGQLRQMWVRLASVELSVRIANVSPEGVGLISREPFTKDQRIRVTPEGTSEGGALYETATLRVVHCTPTINGYKVGCVFV